MFCWSLDKRLIQHEEAGQEATTILWALWGFRDSFYKSLSHKEFHFSFCRKDADHELPSSNHAYLQVFPKVSLGALSLSHLTAQRRKEEEKRPSRRQVPQPHFPARKEDCSLGHSGDPCSSKQRRSFGSGPEQPKVTTVMRDRKSVLNFLFPHCHAPRVPRPSLDKNGRRKQSDHFPLVWLGLSLCMEVGCGHNQWE